MSGAPAASRRGRSGGGHHPDSGPIDWFATLSRGRPESVADLYHRSLRETSGQLILILLDSSGSTLKGQALSTAKGAVASLIEVTYRQRTRVGMLQFAGHGTRLSLPPRRAPKRFLTDTITGGGGTPLRQGLEQALRLLERERRRLPHEQQTLVLLTDGRSRDRIDDIQPPCRVLVIDMETGPIRLGRCRQLASVLKGEYLTLDSLPIRR